MFSAMEPLCMAIARNKRLRIVRLMHWTWLKLKYNLHHLRGNPEQIAGGAAVGAFIAFTPTIGIQCVLALLVATILKVNRIAAFTMVWITNVFTMLPIYFFVCWVGKLVLSRRISYESFEKVSWSDPSQVWNFFIKHYLALWLGAVIVGLISAGISYIVLFNMTKYYRALREKKREKRKERFARDASEKPEDSDSQDPVSETKEN